LFYYMGVTGCSNDCEEWSDGGDGLGREHSSLVHFDQCRGAEPGSR